MPSSYTSSLSFTLQATGENLNTWGNILNSGCFQLIDSSIAGRVAFSTSGAKTLTTTQGASNEARNAIIDVTGGTGVTVTAPAVSKLYFVKNGSSGDVTLTTGGATNATVKTGERIPVISDGTNYYRFRLLDMGGDRLSNLATPTQNNDAATKAYADGLAFNSINLPGQSSATEGMVVASQSSSALWRFDGYQGRRTYSSNHTVAFSERNMLIAATAALTFTMDAATTLKDKYIVRLTNEASSNVTIGVTGSDTINGVSSILLYPGETVDVTGDGANFFTAKYIVQANSGPHVIIQNQVTSGTSADTIAIGVNTRTLNTTVRNVAGASLASNRVTLPTGTWRVWGRSPVSAITGTGKHRAYLYNYTDSADAILGSSGVAPGANIAATNIDSVFEGVITISASKQFEIRHYSVGTGAGGAPASSGQDEVYTQFFATRIA